MTARRVVIALVALLLSLCGGAALAYTDAQILGLELSGQLLAPPEMVTQIAADLMAIRHFDPYFWNIHVLPEWIPGELSVGLTPGAWQLFLAGQYHGLDALNAQYGPVQVEWSTFIPFLHLTFSQPYHSEVLAAMYAIADGVQSAEPNFTIGGGNDIVASSLGSYTFKHGWGDCTSGCAFEHYWDFTIASGVVQLVNEYGDLFGACCLANGGCAMALRWECEDDGFGYGGTFHGGPCLPSPCGATAAGGSEEQAAWGEVKSRYR